MGVDIRAQALSLLLGCALGAGLGLLYDLLRPIRRRGGDTLWDLLFCAAAAFLCFLLAMREENGRLAGGQLMSSLAGLLLYEQLFSPPLAPLADRSAAGISTIWIFSADCLKKIQKNAKKLFQNSRG
jgi:hypothetical protein